MFGSAPLSMAYRHGRGSLSGAAGRGEIPASQTTIPGQPQCTSLAVACGKRRILGTMRAPYLCHGGSAWDGPPPALSPCGLLDRIGRA